MTPSVESRRAFLRKAAAGAVVLPASLRAAAENAERMRITRVEAVTFRKDPPAAPAAPKAKAAIAAASRLVRGIQLRNVLMAGSLSWTVGRMDARRQAGIRGVNAVSGYRRGA